MKNFILIFILGLILNSITLASAFDINDEIARKKSTLFNYNLRYKPFHEESFLSFI